MRTKKTIHLVLKREFFEAIARGEKTSEYRAVGPYWVQRINPSVKEVVFQLGYGTSGKPPPRMRFRVKEVRLVDSVHNKTIPYPVYEGDIPKGFLACLFELKLGKRLE